MSDDGLHADLAVHRSTFSLDVASTVEPGEVLAVLGPNGAGKSTFLSVLTGTQAPSRGRVTLGDRVWVDTGRGLDLPTHRRRVGLLAQQALLFPNLTALDNVAFGPRAAGYGRKAARDTATRWLDEVDARELAGRRPAQLSGGQAQRIAVARALASDPDLLLLDEPLAALDIDAAPAMRALLHRVLRGQRRPTVLVTHDVLDAVVLSDRVVVLSDGEIVEQGPTRDVLARPKAPFTARLAGLNLMTGIAADGGIATGAITINGRVAEPVVAGEPGAAVFAPSAVAVHRQHPDGSPRNAIPVRLAGIEPRGDVVRLRAVTRAHDVDLVLAADITPAAVADLELTVGDEVVFAVKATEVAIHPASGGSSAA